MSKNISTKIKVYFNNASDKQPLQSGDLIEIIIGQVAKWLSDLKPIAFSGSYYDLDDIPPTDSSIVHIDENGDIGITGKITVGESPTTNMDLTTKEYVDTSISEAINSLSINTTLQSRLEGEL